MFSGGKLLGTFKGPATREQRVEIQSADGWENTFGRYLIIQMNFGNAKNYLNLKEVFAVGVSTMVPAAATLSTTYKHFSAKKCINGITTGRDLCHSKRELAPWLALDYGKGTKVSVEKVVLFNREDSYAGRTKNVQIRLSNKLPDSGNKMFSGGKLQGTFKGPATRGQRVEIQSNTGWENTFGRYLVIQMDFGKAANYLNLQEVFAVGVSTMVPAAATLSTTYKHFSAKKCINGVTNGNLKDLCHSKLELAPWLALDFGKGAKVSVEKAVLFNRADSYAGRTKNVEIRLSNELPASGNKMFSGGKLLGTFKGPATRGQRVEIQSVTGWENTFGRYLVIQMNFGKAANYLNLLEALALGISHVAPSKMVPAAATMSTTYKHFSVKKCINGITTGSDLCHSKRERAPWLALDFGKGAKVSLEKVVLFNRREGCCWTRTKNVQIRLSNELPRSGRKIFSGGKLLGTFKGPATRGQQVEIQSAIGWENKFGRYLVIQMNFGKAPNYLNLKEVFAFGVLTKE